MQESNQEEKTLAAPNGGRDGLVPFQEINQQLQNNKVKTEPSWNTIGRVDNPNLEEAEENKLKCNFMRMMDTYKEQMKNSLE